MVPAGSVLENDTVRLTAGRGESLILRDGYMTLYQGVDLSAIKGDSNSFGYAALYQQNQKLVIGPGYGTHAFKGHYSGEEKNEAGYSIYLNDYTPYEHTFRIVAER